MENTSKIVEYMKNAKYRGETLTHLRASMHLDSTIISDAVEALHRQGIIFKNERNHTYFLSERYGLKRAELIRVRKNFAIAVTERNEQGEDQGFRIEPQDLKGAIVNDWVLVSSPNNRDGQVFAIIERGNEQIVGEYITDRVAYVQPDDENMPFRILIPPGENKKAQSGHKVVVKMLVYEPEPMGKVESIIGHKNDPRVDVLSLVYRHKAPATFPPEVMDAAEHVPETVPEADYINRTDLRNRLIGTIDGADAKDLDDAVEVHKNPDGTYTLGVHIADVSHYVTKHSPIDQEAVKRGTSIYLLDYVIPMLPHILSNGICSLNPKVDRLAMSCEMIINRQGKVVDYQIYQSVLRSSYRLTYEAVNAFYEGHHNFDAPLASMLQTMLELAQIVRAERESRGALDLDVPEAKILVDEQGKPTDVVLRERGEGERLIEDFMVVANETVASHVYWQSLPFIYRVHESPKQKKLDLLSAMVKSFGYALKGDKTGIHPKELQSLMQRTKGKPEHVVIATMLLRSLAKADYRAENLGHFGLASTCYTHFTSPIRRYPDLLVHRLLKIYLNRPTKIDYVGLEEEINYLALQSSICERRAIDLERAVEDMKKAEYMQDKVGATFHGVVSGIIDQGFFVELPNTIEGMVRFESMNDYYVFDPKKMVATGSGSKKIISLGKKMRVKVKGADKNTGQIEFIPF
jgi:ribonuclease R